ncbi:uncharacterized protein LOC110440478 isoform X2 [Mizuhopecten yessoensis]|uniref:Centrosomal protein of 44 kDa n=1 Tax=Mizuhopecten yessoensis TaxID=6573 RepID=A0A210R177_MIZYE|nr:uncharacterized protein LOC110440478 isoform X2 [Mizuhopecten yessoensis]OWF54788.1 Centrosomal protein of 44 kDa [Mizuhopecten yessoensis]
MPTGDLTNNLRKLQKEIKLIKYNEDINLAEMSLGKPTVFLPLYHFAFTSYNHALAELISASDAELFGKTDFRFIEAVYKILRDLFSYKPLITKEQFFNTGFAERKIIMCSEVLRLVREKSLSLNPPKKMTTGGAAVSGLVQLVSTKGSRPKSADPVSIEAPISTSGRGKRPKTVTNTKYVRVTSPPEVTSAPQVVNELLQPHRPQCHPVRHMTSPMTDHLQHPPLATDVASPPHVTKERLAARVSNQKSSEVHFLPVTTGLTRNRSVPDKHLEEDTEEDEEESEEDEIETVNAVTRGESFLEPQCVDDSPTGQPFVPSQESQQYFKIIQTVVDRMNNLDSVVRNISVEAQAALSPNDKVNATLTIIHQQLETLMARMVLVENRVALVEARLSGNRTVPGEPAMNQGMRDTQHKAGNPEAPHGSSQTVHSANMYQVHCTTHTSSLAESHQEPNMLQTFAAGELYQSNMHCQGGTDRQKALTVLQSLGAEDGSGTQTQSGGLADIHSAQTSSIITPLEAQPADQQMQFPATNHSNGSSVFSDLSRYPQTNLTSSDINDSAAVGLSPIRKPIDLSINNSVTLPPFDFTNDDTFATVTQNEKRLSSTPTKHPVMLESLEDSLSFHFGDPTSQERFLRIKTMIKETEHLLTKPTSTLTEGNS